MQLITHYGIRTDRPLCDLDRMTLLIRTVPYPQLTETDREHVKALWTASTDNASKLDSRLFTKRRRHHDC